MIDFQAIPRTGGRFEALVCELLQKMGYTILQGPAVGPDGGRDILIERTLKDELAELRERVVVQCKHYAHSGRTVRERDLGVWENTVHRYDAQGYLLVTSTTVTENLSRAFSEFTRSNRPRWATYWIGERLEILLAGQTEIRDAFFPAAPPSLNHSLSSCGFGIVLPQNLNSGAVKEALAPLVEFRASQLMSSGGGGEIRWFSDSDGVASGEGTVNWLSRHQIGPGTPDPARVPRFLLLIGDPTQISFDLQTDLAIQYYVGRLPFTDPIALRAYAETAVKGELAKRSANPAINFLAPVNGADRATNRTSRELVTLMAQELRLRLPNHGIVELLGADATKARMLEGFLDRRFKMTFVAAHGLAMARDDSQLMERQGAQLTSDWSFDRPLSDASYISATDFADRDDLTGKVFFLFACYGAGVTTSEFIADQGYSDVYTSPFVAALPQRLLRLGALGVFGHIGRAWTTAFSWVPERPQPHTFMAVVESVLGGEPLGVALQALSKRYAELAATVASVEQTGTQEDLLLRLKLALFDARYHILLGDPCCRAVARRG